jgi:hypothetical protein
MVSAEIRITEFPINHIAIFFIYCKDKSKDLVNLV